MLYRAKQECFWMPGADGFLAARIKWTFVSAVPYGVAGREY